MSMTRSANLGFVLRKRSLTIRTRFTPARICSTTTRIWLTTRLCSRSASLHPCLLLDWLEYHDFCRRERLKTGILMQLAIRRKSIRGSLGQGFVVSRTRPVPLKKRTFRSPRSPMTTFLSVCVFFTAVVCTLHRIVRGTLSRALGSINHKAVAFTRGEYAFACGGVTSGQKEIPLQRCLPHVG